MGAVSFSSGSGSFNVPSVVQQVWVSCIGGGGNGSWGDRNPGGPRDPEDAFGGGGGGWGYGTVFVSSTSISYIAGGISSSSSCLGIIGGGASGQNGGGFAGPQGANGGNGAVWARQAFTLAEIYAIIRGGHAGGVTGNGLGTEIVGTGVNSGFYMAAGGGGNGNDGFGNIIPGQNAYTVQTSFGIYDFDVYGGNGGTYGGGGGGVSFGSFGLAFPGSGTPGLVYVSWIDITAGATTLRSGESTTVSWSSPVDSGSESVSYTNNGTSNITQTYTRTDSRGAQSTITFTILPAARINTFTANPFSQTSGFDGVPNYDTILSWTSVGATSASITNIGSVEPDDSITVTNLPQSVAGVTSPATRTYTLTVSDGFNTDTETVTVSVTNDNTPNDFSISNRSDLQPDTFYVINLGSITGIDMITNVIGGPGVTVSKNNLDNYVSSITIVNGDIVQLRFRSDPFNPDPTGQPTAPKTLSVTIGTLTRSFTISTRAPDVNEEFNLPDENNRVPFPDIDTINEPSLPYITSDTLSIDDIQLQAPSGVEIKTDNPNIQVRVNGGPWEDVRSI